MVTLSQLRPLRAATEQYSIFCLSIRSQNLQCFISPWQSMWLVSGEVFLCSATCSVRTLIWVSYTNCLKYLISVYCVFDSFLSPLPTLQIKYFCLEFASSVLSWHCFKLTDWFSYFHFCQCLQRGLVGILYCSGLLYINRVLISYDLGGNQLSRSICVDEEHCFADCLGSVFLCRMITYYNVRQHVMY